MMSGQEASTDFWKFNRGPHHRCLHKQSQLSHEAVVSDLDRNPPQESKPPVPIRRGVTKGRPSSIYPRESHPVLVPSKTLTIAALVGLCFRDGSAVESLGMRDGDSFDENQEPKKKRKTDRKAPLVQGSTVLSGHSRTIYLGGVTPEINANDVFSQIKGGAVEALRFLTEKSCAFIDFVDEQAALSFYTRLATKRFVVKGTEIRIGWAKPTPIGEHVSTAIRNGATRNIYIGSLSLTRDSTAEELEYLQNYIRSSLQRFGVIDQIKLVPERQCAFVHLTSIADAMKAVSVINGEDEWLGKKIGFGRDRCADRTICERREEGQIDDDGAHPKPAHPIRTIYLGGLPAETTAEDLCNVIRGGLLEKVRVTPEKRCAFITFIEVSAAEAFYDYATTVGINVRGVRPKPGWGQPSALPNAVIAALRQGATRNIYIGNLDLSKVSESDLHSIFSSFGPIELINFLRRDKDVAFVNFCCLLDAVKAVEGIRKDPLFRHCTISYGKDRCAQPLRSVPKIDPYSHFMVPVQYLSYPVGYLPTLDNHHSHPSSGYVSPHPPIPFNFPGSSLVNLPLSHYDPYYPSFTNAVPSPSPSIPMYYPPYHQLYFPPSSRQN